MKKADEYGMFSNELFDSVIPDEKEKVSEFAELIELEIEDADTSDMTLVKHKKGKIKKIILRMMVAVSTLFFIVVFDVFGGIVILNYGPSKTVRNLFVNSVMESSAGKFMATCFFSDEEIKEIRAENSVISTDEVTDSNLIVLDEQKSESAPIEIIDIVGGTYKGKLVIVHDPSRLTVGVSGEFGSSYSGKTVKDMAISYNASLAINGGGFNDPNGAGNGGTPVGIVISEGVLKYGSLSETYEVIGFDRENKLVVGKMTGRQALDRGVRDALSFGPILIVNGEPSVVNGSGSGLNPRSAIGQRADGAMLLLVIDGRQANSLGASYADIVEIMLQYGAINAANLDGGSSTLLYSNGEYINNCSSLYGPRCMPTSIVVR